MVNELTKRINSKKKEIEEGMEIADVQVDVDPEVERYKKMKNKHKVEEQIK